MTRSRQTADWGSRAGLAKIVPSSVTVGSGTGSADSLGTVTFSGCSSISLNGIFSSTYNNYRLISNLDSSAAAVGWNVRMRSAGTDNTSANYSYANVGTAGNGAVYAGASNGASLATSFVPYAISGTYTSTSIIDVMMPFNSSYNTNFLSQGHYWDSSTNYAAGTVGGVMSVTTSYDGITLFPASGTISGIITILGYN